jgi:hypothetical protein
VLNWTFKDGSFRSRVSNEFALCPRPSGGLGILDPICQQHAIHAMWLVKILLTPSPLSSSPSWRSLLVLALNDAAFELAGHYNILGFNWTEKVGDAQNDLKTSPTLSLAHNILRAWSLLRPQKLPAFAPSAVIYDPRLGFTRASINALFLTEAQLDAIRVCNDVRLSALTVQKAAAFIASILRPNLSPIVPEKNTSLNATPQVWAMRWNDLNTSRLPAQTRQFLFRFYHGKLNWGQKKDNPDPLCPFCGQPDGLQHFVALCPTVSHAKHLLQDCWEFWTGAPFPPEDLLRHVSKDQRWNSVHHLLLHCRYCIRAQASIHQDKAEWHEVIGDFRKKLSLFITLLLRPPPDGNSRPLSDEWSMNGKWFMPSASGKEARVRLPNLFNLYDY